MDQKTAFEQPKGNFTMNLNFRRGKNNNGPAVTGRISTPENPDKLFDFSAFEHTEADKETGELKTYYIGPVTASATMREALAQKKDNGAHFIAIRPNQFKVFETLNDGTPNPAYLALSDDEKAKEDLKPAWWAKWTRTQDLPVLDASAWDREASRYGPWASGHTQHHMSKNQLEQAASVDAEPSRGRRQRARSEDAEMSR